jgi:hypothetical protein
LSLIFAATVLGIPWLYWLGFIVALSVGVSLPPPRWWLLMPPTRRNVILAAAVVGVGCLYWLALIMAVAIGVAVALPTPDWMLSVFPTRRGATVSSLLLGTVVGVLLASLPIAWIVNRLYGQFRVRIAMALAFVVAAALEGPIAADMVGGSWSIKGMWLSDVLLFSLMPAFLVWLFRGRPSNSRWSGP